MRTFINNILNISQLDGLKCFIIEKTHLYIISDFLKKKHLFRMGFEEWAEQVD